MPSNGPRATARLRRYGLNGVFFDEMADVAYNDSLRYVVELKRPVARNNHLPLRTGLQLLEKALRDLREKHHNEESLLHLWTLSKLKQEIPQIEWQTYFEELLEMEPRDDKLLVQISDVEYFRKLGELLRESNKTILEFYLRSDWLALTRSEDMRQLQQMFASLRGTFAKYLELNRLELSSEQLTYLHAKLANMQLKLGNLPDTASTDNDFYNNHYASASFTADDFVENFWQALRLRTHLQHLPARNAPYFEHERNMLTVPLVFMQWPFYDYRQHSVFRHSLMGFILGHELSHAFEQEGILFDAAGNELHSPTASLKERLADFNGLQLAYDTFFGLGHDSNRFEYRPYEFEQEMSPPQLFHLNFAQFFCGRLPTAIGHDMDDVR
ncbi:neprilysin-like, partial [Drosophila hydei]|uniref:Neprilysin-like n=1 Tax=Drosophila hydei TaxID=7224 RepID=A0A6J2SUG1_DROHY